MKRREILQTAAASTSLPAISSVASASSNGSGGLDTTILDGRKEQKTLLIAWQDIHQLRLDVQRRYEVRFSFKNGKAKKIRSEATGDELTVAAFRGTFNARGNERGDSREALVTWTAENGVANEPEIVVEGMASDFEDLSRESINDPDFVRSVSNLEASQEEAMHSHVSAVRIHKQNEEMTYLNVHSQPHNHGLITERVRNHRDTEVHPQSQQEGSDIVYSTRIRATKDGISVLNHGGGDLMDCLEDAPLGASAVGCLAACVNAGTIIGAAACAGCGCFAGCWVASCSKHIGNEYCSAANFGCGLAIFFPPTAGTCCLAFGCHFGCGWIG